MKRLLLALGLAIGMTLFLLSLIMALARPVRAESFGPYRAHLVRVIDGDTVEMEIALWPGLTEKTSLRLAGLDAPELRAADECERRAAGLAAVFVHNFLAGHALVVSEIAQDKYGRALGKLAADGNDLGAALLAAGLARPYAGGQRGPWCTAA